MADLKIAVEYFESKKKLSANDFFELATLEINPVSKAAMTAAALHYISGQIKSYPWAVLELDEPVRIETSFTVSIDTPEKMAAEIRDCRYPIIKIKMGFDGDEILVELLNENPDRLYRIDANGGWDLEKAEKMIHLLSEINVELVEQPTVPEYAREWRYLKKGKKVPLFIDEGLGTAAEYNHYAEYVDGINIKMAKSGGIIEAVKIARMARRDKIKIMLGCMVESSVGIAPAVYLSSLADYFDLDGPLLMNQDIATGLNFNLEKIEITEDIIGGPKIKDEFLREA